jgi:hypothetical protein
MTAPDTTDFDDLVTEQRPYTTAAAITFLKALDPRGWHNLVAFDPLRKAPVDQCTFPPGSWDRIADWLSRHAGSHNIYYSVNEPKPGSPNKKLGKNDIGRIRAVWIDLDPQGGADEYEAERRRIREVVDGLIDSVMPPSFVIDSGGGYQGLWVLDQPIDVTPQNAETAEAVGDSIAFTFRGDAIQNIDRILRLPGTDNIPNAMKRRRGRTRWAASVYAATGARHQLDRLSDQFQLPERNRQKTYANTADWEKHCAQIDVEILRHLREIDELPEELYRRFQAALMRSPRLRALWERGEKHGDRSGSGYVASLGFILNFMGFSLADFAMLTAVWPFAAGNGGRELNAGPRSLGRVWAKASDSQMAEREQIRRAMREEAANRALGIQEYRERGARG